MQHPVQLASRRARPRARSPSGWRRPRAAAPREPALPSIAFASSIAVVVSGQIVVHSESLNARITTLPRKSCSDTGWPNWSVSVKSGAGPDSAVPGSRYGFVASASPARWSARAHARARRSAGRPRRRATANDEHRATQAGDAPASAHPTRATLGRTRRLGGRATRAPADAERRPARGPPTRSSVPSPAREARLAAWRRPCVAAPLACARCGELDVARPQPASATAALRGGERPPPPGLIGIAAQRPVCRLRSGGRAS